MTTRGQKQGHQQARERHECEVEIKQLTGRIQELQAGWQRTQADFENFRRHWQEEKQSLQQFITINNLMEISPILDNFQRAFDQLESTKITPEWVTGFKQIQKQLLDLFVRYGLIKIATVDEQFDPGKHEAISELPSQEVAPGVILKEIEAGYQFKDKVIKPAKVIVSKGKIN